jgi:hypothetical protein
MSIAQTNFFNSCVEISNFKVGAHEYIVFSDYSYYCESLKIKSIGDV